ncbi:glycosyltransferase involved in cell wall biosynthesis [Acinetobacter baylyi]|uniref:Glycosyltransferase involved in cell wall biosynthesis n=1 Tax=Acinetobacter baylyi TaxID=202950 RepID=A0ABU0UXI4_ACIBI|nr:glycosyltransferase [Acinetobacter baylyi]MDQ1209271.1 glycosyltransferase involved in cell wall biosynthesis [Acinetobacter baylyi]MDR6107138.1 glycosyltransferase involved in cell wall biosynthesis [Acinetobacter baylyi]MDR6186142.1 glycosyltransferase involved in cell wall biosynthesis [Acinetobacter baylyi]
MGLEYKKIVFWEPSLSPHKIDLVNTIGLMDFDIETVYLSARGISEQRKNLGWNEKGYEDCIINPSSEQINHLMLSDVSGSFHIFSGIKGGDMFENALSIAKNNNKIKFAIMSEPRASEGVKGFLRYLHSWVFEGWLRRQSQFIFAIGANGSKWFKSVGYSHQKIRNFAYFISNEKYKSLPVSNNENPVVGYVGRLVKEKGFHDVLEASKYQSHIQFKFIGAGEGTNILTDYSNKYSNIMFGGAVDMSEIPYEISKMDILVLPSHTTDDGWGMVISEALMAGCYIITTNKVGSSILIFCDEIGTKVNVGSPEQISDAIQNAIQKGFISVEMKVRRKQWALRNLSSENGATFLLNAIFHRSQDLYFFDKDF